MISLEIASEYNLPAESIRHMAAFIIGQTEETAQRDYAMNLLEEWNQVFHGDSSTAEQKLALQLAAIELLDRTTFEETQDLRLIAGLLEQVIYGG